MTASALNLSAPVPDTIRELWSGLDLTIGRLLLVLKVLMGLVAVLLVVGLVSSLVMTRQLGWLGMLPLLALLIGGVIWGLGLLLYTLALNAGRQAVKVVSRYCEVGKPRVTLVADLNRCATWLNVGQWLIILGFLTNVGSVLTGVKGSDLPMTARLVVLLFAGGINFAQWSAIESVKRFFVRFSQRAMGARLPMQDAAARAATWLQIGVVLMWIGLVFTVLAVLGGLIATVLPSQIPGSHLRANTGLLLFGMTAFYMVFGGLALWVNFLMINLLGQARQFMQVAAANADQRLGSTEGAVLSDTWMP